MATIHNYGGSVDLFTSGSLKEVKINLPGDHGLNREEIVKLLFLFQIAADKFSQEGIALLTDTAGESNHNKGKGRE